jgi:hypothetical protein
VIIILYGDICSPRGGVTQDVVKRVSDSTI